MSQKCHKRNKKNDSGVVYSQTNYSSWITLMNMLKHLMTMSMLAAISACSTLSTPTFANKDGAIRGYDPVAYHTESMPVKGDSAYSYDYNDGVWYFSNEENLQLFSSDPERYAPVYGGYCAYGMSKGHVVSTDPNAWTIEDGRLYLNYSLGVRKTWLKDVPGNIEKANANWQEKTSQPGFE